MAIVTEAYTPYVPPNVRAIVRRSVLIALVVGVATAVLLGLLGHLLWGLFGLLGLTLGAGNLWAVQRSAAVYADRRAGKKGSAIGLFGRLAIITVIALGCAFFVRPEGIGTIVGVAVFQFISVVVSASPMTKEMRKW